MYIRYVLKLNTGEIIASSIIVNSKISVVEDIMRSTAKHVEKLQNMQRSSKQAVAYSLVLNYRLKRKIHTEEQVGPLVMLI